MHVSAGKSHVAHAGQAQPRRLLLPVDATDRSRWSLAYAKACRNAGHPVAVSLLLVSEPVTSWQVLRFLTQERVRRFQAERGNDLLQDAANALAQAGIPATVNYREGDIVFEILDAAEQLDCEEIVLPAPHAKWVELFSMDLVREVRRRQRSVPVTTVDSTGQPVQEREPSSAPTSMKRPAS